MGKERNCESLNGLPYSSHLSLQKSLKMERRGNSLPPCPCTESSHARSRPSKAGKRKLGESA